MAKSGLEVPFNQVSGRISKDSEIYYTNRFGQTVVSNYPKHRDPKKITAHQHDLNARFSQAVVQAGAELADSARRAYWQDLFDRQKEPKQYKTLRGFIIARLTKQQ